MKYILSIAMVLMPFWCMSQSDFQKNYQMGKENYARGIYNKALENFKNAEKTATKNYEKTQAYKGLADCYKAISDNIHALAY